MQPPCHWWPQIRFLFPMSLATDEVRHDLHHCCAKCNPLAIDDHKSGFCFPCPLPQMRFVMTFTTAKCNPLAIDDHKSGFCFPCPLPQMRFVMTFTTAVLSATLLHWWPQIRFLFPMSLATDEVRHDLHHCCAKCNPLALMTTNQVFVSHVPCHRWGSSWPSPLLC